jgi:hypothetical protein
MGMKANAHSAPSPPSPRARRSLSARSLLRSLGRVAIWIVVGLLLVRGLGAVLAPRPANVPSAGARSGGSDQASAAFAVRFARTYLSDPSPRALAPFLVEGASVGSGRPPGAAIANPAQAEVSATQELGGGREVLTVACELRDARTLYLAVPILREGAGDVAALGAPSIVAAPGGAGADPERPQPLAGPDGAAIRQLVAKFAPQYLSASESSDLAYLLAPGASVMPLGGAVRFVLLSRLSQLGSGEGPRRTVLAAVRVADPASGAIYPLLYRLEVVKQGRWYVGAIEGASA